MHVWKINFQMEREGKIVEISVKYSFNLIITAFTLSCQCQKILIAFFFLRTTTLKDSRGIKECPINVQLSGGGVCKFMIHTDCHFMLNYQRDVLTAGGGDLCVRHSWLCIWLNLRGPGYFNCVCMSQKQKIRGEDNLSVYDKFNIKKMSLSKLARRQI